MLHKVPSRINVLTRNVVINHPNTFNCQLYRKVNLRRGSGHFAENATMGGIGVLDSDDEENYLYEYQGDGYALPAEGFQPAELVDRNDANIGPTNEFRFLIEPAAQSNEPGFFEVVVHDLVYLLMYIAGSDKPAKLAFEVVARETTTNIPPFNARYVCNRRDDLHLTPDGKHLSEV